MSNCFHSRETLADLWNFEDDGISNANLHIKESKTGINRDRVVVTSKKYSLNRNAVILISTVVSAVRSNDIALVTIVGEPIESTMQVSTDSESEFFVMVFTDTGLAQRFRASSGVASAV